MRVKKHANYQYLFRLKYNSSTLSSFYYRTDLMFEFRNHYAFACSLHVVLSNTLMIYVREEEFLTNQHEKV